MRPSLSVFWKSEIAAKKGVFVFSYFNPDPPSGLSQSNHYQLLCF